MISKVKLLFFLLIFLFFNEAIFAQKKFAVTIQFPLQWDKEEVKLSYDNGIERRIDIQPSFKGNQITISENFYSNFAAIFIKYNESNKRFFVGERPATITFYPNDTKESLDSFKLSYAYDLEKIGAKKLKSFIADDEEDLISFLKANGNKMNDSLFALARKKSDNILNKKTQFVKQNGGSYYSFWIFRRSVAYNNTIPADSLYEIYNTLFHDSLKQSREGAEIIKIIRGKNIKKNQQAPGFTATDINGKTISLNQFRGKYVLLNFWASWCGPCVAELPMIVQARKRYPKDKLAIIFINRDSDSTSFAKAVEKYDINFGRHIFDTTNLTRTYGAQALPQLYLIDPKGIIIYSRDEEKDYKLEMLTELLEERL